MGAGSSSLEALIRDLRKFEGSKEVVKQLRKEIREPVPAVRKAIRARAVATLPRRGGLGKWAAKSRINVSVKLSGRSAGVKLRAGRNSEGGRSDIKRLDKGRLRAPTYGRRTRGSWHTQSVTPGFVTKPTKETKAWRKACVRATNNATKTIRRGR